MRYSQMSPELRRWVLDEPYNYPLRLSFLGKRGLLSFEEVAFLRQHGVDFDVDDKQLKEILVRQGAPPGSARARSSTGRIGRLLTIIIAIISVLAVLKGSKRNAL